MSVKIQPDALQAKFKQAGWVTDIIYLIYHQQRVYLSTILDLQSRDLIGVVIFIEMI
jgi:hypothetical protein